MVTKYHFSKLVHVLFSWFFSYFFVDKIWIKWAFSKSKSKMGLRLKIHKIKSFGRYEKTEKKEHEDIHVFTVIGFIIFCLWSGWKTKWWWLKTDICRVTLLHDSCLMAGVKKQLISPWGLKDYFDIFRQIDKKTFLDIFSLGGIQQLSGQNFAIFWQTIVWTETDIFWPPILSTYTV